jgi:rod shape-determining protein MreD
MNRLLRYLFFGLAVAVLQTTLIPSFDLFGQRPDLVVVFAAAVGAFEGASWGSTAGFLLGLLVDLHHPPSMGAGAMGGALAGWLGGKAQEYLDLELPLNQFVAFAAARFANDLAYAVVVAVKELENFWTVLLGRGLGGAVLTGLVGLVVMRTAYLMGAGRNPLDRR